MFNKLISEEELKIQDDYLIFKIIAKYFGDTKKDKKNEKISTQVRS